ncbi:MAG: heparinase II/III domain-containing protein [Armatimonadota bacterium]
MLFGIHLQNQEIPALRKRLLGSEAFDQLRQGLQCYLNGPNTFELTKFGFRNSSEVNPYELGHNAAALSLFHGIEPTPQVADVLTQFLRWTLEQESLMWGQNISLGQFLKGAVLALDAVGEEMDPAECAAILQHMIDTCIQNDDPDALPNNHPTGAIPMRPYLEIPGRNFHVPDAQVNNWDVVCGQGLLYVARAAATLLPEYAVEAETWVAIARRRLERFLDLIYTPQGEYGEGPGYYSYGTFAGIMMLDCLACRQGGCWLAGLPMEGLLASARWSREVCPREVEHGTFNINDCSLGRLESPAVLHWIAARTQDPIAQGYGDVLLAQAVRRLHGTFHEHSFEGIAYALCWRDKELAAEAPAGWSARHFGRFGSVICRTGYTSDDICLWTRSGDYAGAHTHADRGGFLLTAYGENLVSEAGCPTDRSIPAFKAFHTQVDGHNCARPLGQSQQREVEGTYLHGALTEFREEEGRVFIREDCSAVYPGAGAVTREITFSRQGWVLIHDRIEQPGEGIEFLLHTDNHDRQAMATITPDRLRITRPNASLLVIPLNGAEIVDLGANYQDSDTEGLRSFALRRDAIELTILLIACRRGEEETVAVERLAGNRWQFHLAGESEEIMLGETASPQ